MNYKEFLIIAKIHRANEPISPEQLANYFNVNVKTIRNHIESIQNQYKNIIQILGGKYYVNRKRTSELLNEYIIHVPETEEGRMKYIVYKVTMNEQMKMNIYDLCEILFVSRSFLLSLISKLKHRLSLYNIAIITKNEIVSIEGNEIDIQHLFVDEIYDNNAKVYPTPTLLNLIFEELDSYELFKICKSEYYKVNGFHNDYRCFYLTTRLCILISRVKKGFRIDDNVVNKHLANKNEKFIKSIEEKYSITFNTNEKNLINIWISPTNPFIELIDSDDKIVVFVKEQIGTIEKKYNLKMTDNKIIQDLSTLIKNMIYRNIFDMNLPLFKDISMRESVFSNASEYLYDSIISKYNLTDNVTSKIKIYHMMLNCFTVSKSTNEIIKIGLIILETPNAAINKYIDLETSIYKDLVVIKEIWNCEEEIDCEAVDVIVSFQNLIKFYSVPVLVLNSLYVNENVLKLEDFIRNYIEEENKFFNKNFYLL